MPWNCVVMGLQVRVHTHTHTHTHTHSLFPAEKKIVIKVLKQPKAVAKTHIVFVPTKLKF